MARKLTKKGFREWLETHDSSAMVGISHNMNRCPIAQWSGKPYNPRGKSGWHAKFARKVDGPGQWKGFCPITAKRALEILDSL